MPFKGTLSGVTPLHSGYGDADVSPAIAILVHVELPAGKVSRCFAGTKDGKTFAGTEFAKFDFRGHGSYRVHGEIGGWWPKYLFGKTAQRVLLTLQLPSGG